MDEVVNCLKGLGEDVNENTIVRKVLRSPPNCFDAKVCAIEELKYLVTLSINELHGIFTTYEMKAGNPSHKEVAFKASKSSCKGNNINFTSDDSNNKMA